MLLELRISNLALAEDVALRPGPGLTVLTGETGAGKSLVAGALHVLAGGRAERGLVRRGEDLAWVEAVCDLSARTDLREAIARLGIRCADDALLVLRRELRREGRGRVLINGEISSLAVLERLGEMLFVVQSQHQQRELAAAGYARDLLDAVLGNASLRGAVSAALSELRAVQAMLARRRREQELAAEQVDFWRYQWEELNTAALQPGEEEDLAEAIAVKRHARALQEAAALALSRVDGGPTPARESLGAAIAALRSAAARSQRLATALQCLEVAADQTAEAAGELERFLDGLETDPREAAELEQRKALYEELRRKHQRDVAGLVALRDQLAERLARLDQAGDDLAQLSAGCEAARQELTDACLALRRSRQAGASAVAAAAEDVIRPLALPALELSFAIEPQLGADGAISLDGEMCVVDAAGADKVRLLVRTNPGEGTGEVAAIASGGELARIHLGLTVLRRSEQAPLLRLFDEVDAGLGMDAATPVAWLLRDLAEHAQAVCITHLPTVAVHGQQHWRVAKLVTGGRTALSLRELAGQDRVDEIARQLGGEGWRRGDAAAQLAYARELLAAAEDNAAPRRAVPRAQGGSA